LSFGICRNQKNHSSSSFPPSNRPPSRSADTAPTNACVCGLLPASPLAPPLPRGNLSWPLPCPFPLVVAVSFHPRRDYSDQRETRPKPSRSSASASESDPSLLQILDLPDRFLCSTCQFACLDRRLLLCNPASPIRVAFAHPAIWVGRLRHLSTFQITECCEQYVFTEYGKVCLGPDILFLSFPFCERKS
jgi:hypothetical protein